MAWFVGFQDLGMVISRASFFWGGGLPTNQYLYLYLYLYLYTNTSVCVP